MEEEIIVIEDDDIEKIEIEEAGGGGGTTNYEYLLNKPKINNVELVNNKTFKDLGINEITNTELEKIFKDL